MLLSFAQFEREVTGERIRDKIAASKRKGMWMGGWPPLGYDVRERKLLVNEREAETVRHIYRGYAALGSVLSLKDELDRDGVVSKARVDRFGRPTGSSPLARGALYLMLQNRIYRGGIVHKESSYPGEHAAIIDEALWEEVQRKLASNRIDRATGAGAAQPSLLVGLKLSCAEQCAARPSAPRLCYDDARSSRGSPYHHHCRKRLSRDARRIPRTAAVSRAGDERDRARKPRTCGVNWDNANQKKSLIYQIVRGWRRERDSNPRWSCPHTHFPGVRLRPLGHPSRCAAMRL